FGPTRAGFRSHELRRQLVAEAPHAARNAPSTAPVGRLLARAASSVPCSAAAPPLIVRRRSTVASFAGGPGHPAGRMLAPPRGTAPRGLLGILALLAAALPPAVGGEAQSRPDRSARVVSLCAECDRRG